ncbi:MAG: AAA family ATPase [Nitrospirae bacterium]|nr:AAA family ATPase [Nitrospirota bacterium]MBI5696048.1 AAA family ATPase [Nitrospirota bacterium]
MHKILSHIYYEVREPQMTWDNIGGFQDIKDILKEMVCLPLTKGKELAGMNVEVPTGVMIWGPLGVGITMLAEAAATEAGVGYVYISGQEMLGKPEALRTAFHEALHEAPCVLFISDTEWLCPRAGADYEWETGNFRGIPPTFADKELSEVFIQEIDALHGVKDVALVGSCYRVDTVDQAIIKEHRRFNRKVFMHPPTVADREGILKVYFDKMKMYEKVDSEVTIEKLATMTEGYVGWDIESLCKRAALTAVKSGDTTLTMKHFNAALAGIDPWLTPGMTRKYYDIREKDCPHHYAF